MKKFLLGTVVALGLCSAAQAETSAPVKAEITEKVTCLGFVVDEGD